MNKLIACLIFGIIFSSIIVLAGTQEDFLNLLNQERNSLGRNNLTIHPALVTAAEAHSQDMFINNFFSHTSSTGNNSMQRMVAAGFIGIMYGENIAAHTGDEDAQKLFDMWKNSPGHYQNMINPGFNFMGLGIVKGNWENFSGAYSTIYTLDLGQQNIVCQENQTRICGTNNLGACKLGNQTCTNNIWGICEGAINPVSEICGNNLDDDCDNQMDECCNSQFQEKCYSNDVWYYNDCNTRTTKKQECGVYGCSSITNQCNQPSCPDNDRDGFNDINCGGEDCNDNNKQVNPNSTEVCNNQDENCNNIIDENCADNLRIVTNNDTKTNSTANIFQLSTIYLKGYVYYSLDSIRWYIFCSNSGNCSKSLYLSQGKNNIYFKSQDYFNYTYYSSITRFVDSIKPRIIRQSPSNLQYANGTFTISYSEANPKEIALFLGNITFTKVASRDDCPNGSSKICFFNYNLSDYDGKQIKYYFQVSDLFSSVKSSPYTIKVDLTPPIIQINKFKKDSSSFSYSRYSLNLTLNEISKLEYNSSLSLSKKLLCSSCTNTRIFYITIYNPQPTYLDITATDLAGNKKIERVNI